MTFWRYFPHFIYKMMTFKGFHEKASIFTIGFPIVMKISPESHSLSAFKWNMKVSIFNILSENFCKSLLISHSSQENYTEHMVGLIKKWKHSSTFFRAKNFRKLYSPISWSETSKCYLDVEISISGKYVCRTQTHLNPDVFEPYGHFRNN